MQALSSRFVEESSLELHQFLNAPLSQALQPRLRELDAKDGLGPDRLLAIPSHTTGTVSQAPTFSNDHASYFNPRPLSNHHTKTPPTNSFSPNSNWTIRGPPHKWRYCTLSPKPQHKLEAVTPRSAHVSSDEIMRSLQDELFPSDAFRAWLAIVAGLVPVGWICEARRFRPGLDYTLATSEAIEARLDVVLGLTPEVFDTKGSRGHSKDTNWRGSEWGGWEVRQPLRSPYTYLTDIHSMFYVFSVIWLLTMRMTILPFINLEIAVNFGVTISGNAPRNQALMIRIKWM
jgi:hypothetical protein